MIILYCHGLCSDYFLKNYFTKALLVIRRLLQTVPKKIWWLFKEHIKWCCNCAAHLDWGIQTLMESELGSWRMPSQSHCLLWSPKEMCSHSSQVTFYKSLTYFWVLSIQRVRMSWQVSAWAFTFPRHRKLQSQGSAFPGKGRQTTCWFGEWCQFSLSLLLFLKWQRWKEKSHSRWTDVSLKSTWNIFFTRIREKNKAFFPFFFFDNYLLNFWFSYGIEKSIIHTVLLSSCLC